jgi:predicted O-linked N-acetylglucosamine transferase (SPINDLY family)
LRAAAFAYVRAIALGSQDANAFNNLATIYDKLGTKADERAGLLVEAYRLAPEDPEISGNLLKVLKEKLAALVKAGRWQEALPLFLLRATIEPGLALAQREVGYCHAQLGQLEEAIKYFTRAITIDGNCATYYNDLGLACYESRLLSEAQGAFQQVLKLDPKSVSAYTHLGLLANLTGLTGVAVSFLRKALEVDPQCGVAHNNMALYLRDQGDLAGCREHYVRAVALSPGQSCVLSGYLLSLNDDPNADPEWVAAEHRRFQDVVKGEVRRLRPRSLDPERKLRVGYLSPDFRRHSVAFFIAPVLEAHDRESFEVIGYYTGNGEDDTTERIKAAVAGWRKVHRMADEDLVKLMDEDGIDILVELSGHTSDNRLAMLARRAAPVQMTYLGYPNTTGLVEMDYRVTDAIADPPGADDGRYSEQLIRVAGGFLAYAPPAEARELAIAELPARTLGRLTFGSFNNLAKINDTVLDAWSAILAQTPGSRILLKARGLRDERVKERILNAFAARGVAGDERIELQGHAWSSVDHLRLYNQVDVALDTFPYNGTTTTCEALWMGTPLITFAGASHAGRVGASLLDRVGLGELVAGSRQGYVDLAVALGKDWERLAALRSGLREKLLASPLMDPARLARGLEAAYREAWRAYGARVEAEAPL